MISFVNSSKNRSLLEQFLNSGIRPCVYAKGFQLLAEHNAQEPFDVGALDKAPAHSTRILHVMFADLGSHTSEIAAKG